MKNLKGILKSVRKDGRYENEVELFLEWMIKNPKTETTKKVKEQVKDLVDIISVAAYRVEEMIVEEKETAFANKEDYKSYTDFINA